MIPAIPTKVKGRQYRSILEAKWATFFDLCGWNFEYEPFETNGWIPDFLLKGKEESILVEVKPYTDLKEWEVSMIPKIEKGLWGHPFFGNEVLLLGVSPFRSKHYSAYNLGFIGGVSWNSTYERGFEERWPNGSYYDGAPLEYVEGLGFGFCSEYMSYVDRMTGYYDGNVEACDVVIGEALWNKACNLVQWQPKQKPVSEFEKIKELVYQMVAGNIPIEKKVIDRYHELRRTHA